MIFVHNLIKSESIYIQYDSNPKIGGMLLNNAGIAIMALDALLLDTFMSKNKNIK